MNNNAHRFSIEWSCIESDEGEFNEKELEHYRGVLQAPQARGLEPFITLHHLVNPVRFANMGAWTNKAAPGYFERYVEYVAAQLGNECNYWITINEPVQVVSDGYLFRRCIPFHSKDWLGFILSIQNMVRAHRQAYRVLHHYNPRAQVSIAKANYYYHPEGGGLLRFINSIPVVARRYLRNEWFHDRIQKWQDFLGINYYLQRKVSLLKGAYEDGEERTDMGWAVYPDGIYYIAERAYRRYNKPVYITENGIADEDDDQRPGFILDHLRCLHRAIEEGVEIRGYFYWSLLDNFEWLHGFTKRFGLVELNFDTLERTMRPSGRLYGEICSKNAIPA